MPGPKGSAGLRVITAARGVSRAVFSARVALGSWIPGWQRVQPVVSACAVVLLLLGIAEVVKFVIDFEPTLLKIVLVTPPLILVTGACVRGVRKLRGEHHRACAVVRGVPSDVPADPDSPIFRAHLPEDAVAGALTIRREHDFDPGTHNLGRAAVLGWAACLSGCIVLFGHANAELSGDGSPCGAGGWVTGGVLAVGGVVIARWQARAGQPTLNGVSLLIRDPEVRRGATATLGVTTGNLGLPPAIARRLEVGVCCVESYDHSFNDDLALRSVLLNLRRRRRDIYEFEVAATFTPLRIEEAEANVEVHIPRDGPYSFEGEHLSLSWRASVRVKRGWRASSEVWAPIWVLP